jgi:hypothetical protein
MAQRDLTKERRENKWVKENKRYLKK